MQTSALKYLPAWGLTSVLGLSALLIACSTTPDTPTTTAPSAAASAPVVAVKPPAPAANASGVPAQRPIANAASAPMAASVPVAASAPVAAPPAPPSNPTLRPLAEVLRDFKKSEGFFTVWSKEERYLLEIPESALNKPFYFITHQSQGLGERWQWPGLMLDGDMAVLRRIPGDRIQFSLHNEKFTAGKNKPMQRNVAQSFVDSPLATVAILNQAHAGKTLVVDLSQMILGDIPAASARLESGYRAPFALDRNNSFVTQVRQNTDKTNKETAIEVRLQYVLARSLVAQPGQPPFAVPQTIPDPRSVTLGFHYSFSALPETVMPARAADPRVGYFLETQHDFGDDLSIRPRRYHIARWRLEKENEDLAMSPPKKPITFWLDRNVPERYRETVKEGILMWNEAFERIGFQNAIVVKQQADDDAFDTMERHYASVRWLVTTDGSVSIGPTVRDPRSGEILDADILIGDVFPRGARQTIVNDIPSAMGLKSLKRSEEACDFAQAHGEHLHDALDHLMARGEIDPDSPEAEAYVKDYLREVVAHEIGHTLGLTHNFMASSAYTLKQIRDPAFVEAYGVSASVMDYLPSNIGLAGERPTPYFQKRLGAYDLWAIEYGYKPLKPELEKEALKAIAERVRSDKRLAYANDTDAYSGGTVGGVDPDVNTFDLGSDTQAWFERRAQMVKERIDWIAKRAPNAYHYSLARDSIERSLLGLTQNANTLAKKIGGVRSKHEASTEQAVFTPVPESEQKQALNSLLTTLFAPDSLTLPPELLQRLAPDYVERMAGFAAADAPYLPLVQRILNAQMAVVDQLIDDRTSLRLLNSELLRRNTQTSLSIHTLLQSLQSTIWKELDKPGQNVGLQRRNLQRAWSNRLAALIARQGATSIPDVRSQARQEGEWLKLRLQKALKSGGQYNAETRAHLQESLTLIEEALKATLIKLG